MKNTTSWWIKRASLLFTLSIIHTSYILCFTDAGNKSREAALKIRPHHDEEEEAQTVSLDPLIASNSSHYTWTGNQFIPPDGVPMFHPDDFLSYFENRNTLFVGDSTGRRAYATLYGMMKGADLSNIQVIEIDDPNVIDINKKGRRKEQCDIPKRGLFNSSSQKSFLCRNLHNATIGTGGSGMHNESGVRGRVTGSNRNKGITGKFDFVNSVCYKDLLDLFSSARGRVGDAHDEVLNNGPFGDYDLVVVTSGIWEGVRSRDCRMMVNTTQHTTIPISDLDKYDLVLDSMANLSSPDLQFAFRTPGEPICLYFFA